jgi:hypothetical protein
MFASLIRGGAGTFDPASLALTGFWRDYTGSAPWAGTASAGSSGSNNLVTLGADPTSGTALNGHGTASFNNKGLNANGHFSDYDSTTAFSGWALVNATANGYIIGDNSAATVFKLQVGGSTNSLVLTSQFIAVNRAMSSSTWFLATFRFDNVNLQVGVNEAPGASGGASTTADSTALQNDTTTTMTIGAQTVGLNNPITATVAEIALINSAMDDATFTKIKAYVNSRYALSL